VGGKRRLLGNYAGKIQLFTAAVAPPEGTRREGDVYLNLLQRSELYNAATIRAEMGEPFAGLHPPTEKHAEPAYAFSEL